MALQIMRIEQRNAGSYYRLMQMLTTIPFEISGYPVVNMSIAFDSSDAAVFCYLEDVAPDGTVTYITEGMFNPQV
jgi:predicted acyl esterase